MPGGFSYLANFKVTDATGEIVSSSVGSSALLSTCADGITVEVSTSTGKLQIPDHGTAATSGISRGKMSSTAGFWVQGSLSSASASPGGVFQIQNTYAANLVCDRVLIQIDTACTETSPYLDIGIGSSSSTSYDNLIDNGDISAIAIIDNLVDKGTNGGPFMWTTGYYINASSFDSSGAHAATDLVGFYAVHVIDITK
tara:strand:- start:22 stop:615 length:594 start_codon:yes stop_codon:yes gene_type:complete